MNRNEHGLPKTLRDALLTRYPGALADCCARWDEQGRQRQAFGPGLTERKWIHIEPYWRGPEDAPIGVRSHVLPG